MHLKDRGLPAELTQRRYRWPPPRRNRTCFAVLMALPILRLLWSGSPDESLLRFPLEVLTWQGTFDGTTRKCHSNRWLRPLLPLGDYSPSSSLQSHGIPASLSLSCPWYQPQPHLLLTSWLQPLNLHLFLICLGQQLWILPPIFFSHFIISIFLMESQIRYLSIPSRA